ncbi:hypothetical protein [Candidatus Pyrohabitans sp.]
MVNLGTIGKLLVKIEAEGGEKANKQVEKIRQNIKEASAESGRHLPRVERFFRRWGTSLALVGGLLGGLVYTMRSASPTFAAYTGAYLEMFGAIADGVAQDFVPAMDIGVSKLGEFTQKYLELRRQLQEQGTPLAGTIALGLTIQGVRQNIAESIVGGLRERLATAAETFNEWISKIDTRIWLHAQSAKEQISNAWQTIKERVKAKLEEYKNITKEKFKSAKTWMVTYIYLAKQKIEEYIDALREKVRNFVSWAREMLASIRERMSRAKESIFEKARSVVGRQTGGPVFPGNPYIVGERGPELFIPNTSGRIEPLSLRGGDLHLTIRVELDGRQIQESIRRYSMDELRRLGTW